MNNKDLQDYSVAWNEHDIDTIMNFMTTDCVFESGGGPEWIGAWLEGCEADGCDIFTFDSGKIKSKRSYVKDRQSDS